MHAQVRELCTNYGKLDLLWFDFSYDGHCGEDWRAGELVEMVRTLQPGILLNSRLEASGGSLGSLLSGAPTPWAGDFATPEQILPPAPLCRPDGTPVCWEACQTMNNSFGYTAADRCFKTARTCIRQLVGMRLKGGQLPAERRPDARGNIPPQSRRILCEIGEWMRLNADSIYGCGAQRHSRRRVRLPRHRPRQKPLSPRHGAAVGPLALTGLSPAAIRSARVLATGAEADILTSGWAVQNYPQTAFLSLAAQANETLPLPDETDTVLHLTISET